MQTSKLVKNLKFLNKAALSDFGKFINSPYFVERSQLPVLYSRLIKYSPHYSVSKEALFQEAFPWKAYSDQLMRKYISELNKMFEKYLAISAFQKDEYAFTLGIAREKSRLNSHEEVEKITALTIQKLRNEMMTDEDHYFYLYKFETLNDISGGSVPPFSRGESGEQTISTFTDYSAIMILKYYSKLLNNRKYIRMKASVKILDDMIRVFYENGKIESPLATIYYYIIQSLLESGNAEFYFKLKSLIYKNEQRINKDELRGFYIFLHNYCYEKADYGNREFIKERFEIMQQFLQKGYCFENQIMKSEFFSSMILNALSLNKIKPAEEFYNNYSETLPKENRTSLLNFTMANILMHKKQFGKAVELLGKIKYNDIFDNIRTRTLYMMIYFESRMFEPLIYQADAFRHFLKNSNQVTPYVRSRSLHFISQILQIVKFIKGDSGELRIKGFETKAVMNRPWLLEKIKELEQSTN
jgi:hypothetical protein